MLDIQQKRTPSEVYIENRLTRKKDKDPNGPPQGYLTYYDQSAQRMKRRHLQVSSIASIGAVLIPVVANLPWEIAIGAMSLRVSTVLSSLIGLAVAIVLALDRVYHFKEQWQNFRGTEQYLLSQKFRFENRAEEYQSLVDEDEAFKLFVAKVEKAILDENNVTLNILGRAETDSPKRLEGDGRKK